MRNWQLAVLLLLPSNSLMHYLVQAKAKADLHDCKANLASIAAACESYSADNAALFPTSLGQLEPVYLKYLPECPVARPGTGYYQYLQAKNPYCFTLSCTGNNHNEAGEQPNFPQYLNTDGPNYE